jgi:membrane protein required for colicin V production
LNFIDYIIFVFLLIGFILGFKDGLVRKVIGLLGLIIATALSFQFSEDAAVYLSPLFNNENYLAEIISGIIIFFLTIAVIAIIKRVVHPLDKVNKFVNQLLGGLAGIIQLAFLVSGFLLFLNIFDFPNKKDRDESLTYFPLYNLVPSTIDLIVGKNSNAKDFIENIIESKDPYQFPEPKDSSQILE